MTDLAGVVVAARMTVELNGTRETRIDVAAVGFHRNNVRPVRDANGHAGGG